MPSARNRQADVAGRCSLQLRSVVKSYRTGSERRLVLDGLTATFQGPGLVAILGPSGCGKTTLLNILGGLDRSYEGTLLVNGVPTDDFSDADWDCYRGARIGFVFQSPRLVDYLSVSENIEVARRLAAACGADEARVEEPDVQQLLASCGLSGLENALPAQLSGGQAQRASIARALAKAPDIVLADEPTGSLDQESGRQVMELLASAARERLVIVVTHDESLARAYASRIVRLTGGGTVSGDELPDDGLPSGQPDAAGLPRKRRSFPGITRLALRHAVRKKLRSAVTFAAIGLGTLFFLVTLVLSGSNQEYLERLVSSSTLDHPLVAAVKPPSASQGGAGGETSDAGEGVGVDVSGESVLQTYADGYSKPSLLSLRSFLEAGGIMDDVLDVQVSYQTELNIYKEDGTPVLRGGQSMLTDRLDVIGALGLDAKEQIDGQLSSSSLIRELVEDEDASASCYELVSGRMPENENELVLIVDSEGMMLDYVAYTLGFLEDDALVDVMMGSEDAPGSSLRVSYDQIIGTTYRIVPTGSFYYREDGEWVDGRDDDEYLAQLVRTARELTIVGVVKTRAPYDGGACIGSLGYTSDLIAAVVDDAWQTDIVKDQVAHPEVDVFSGEDFETESSAVSRSGLEDVHADDLIALGHKIGLSDAKMKVLEELDDEEAAAIVLSLGVDSVAGLEESLSSQRVSELHAMSVEKFSELVREAAAAAQSTAYQQNLRWLGSVNLGDPVELRIYPKDMAGFEAVKDAVFAYNSALGDTVQSISCESDQQTWLDQVFQTTAAIQRTLDILMGAALALALLLVLCATYISGLARAGEVAVLRAMGASRRNVLWLFLSESLVLGFAAGACGALVACVCAPELGTLVTQLAGMSVQTSLPLWCIVPCAFAAAAASALAGAVPAFQAARRDPATIIRSGES